MKMRKTRVVLKILPIVEISLHHYSSRTTRELDSSAIIFYFECCGLPAMVLPTNLILGKIPVFLRLQELQKLQTHSHVDPKEGLFQKKHTSSINWAD